VSLTCRVLPRDEWDKLRDTECAALAFAPPGFPAEVLVVEDGDTVVGAWSVIHTHDVEGLWVHPDYRKRSSVGRLLWHRMGAHLRSQGVLAVRTGSQTADVDDMIVRCGGQLIPPAIRHYVMPVWGH